MFELFVTHWPALLILIAGYVLLVVEMCVPGFGAPGIAGIVLSIVGIIGLRPSPLQALVISAVYIVILLLTLVICLKSMAKGRLSKSRLVLRDVSVNPAEESNAERLIGKTGVAHTPLRPVGTAIFDGTKISVSSEGDFIESGAEICIIRTEGRNIIVKRI